MTRVAMIKDFIKSFGRPVGIDEILVGIGEPAAPEWLRHGVLTTLRAYSKRGKFFSRAGSNRFEFLAHQDQDRPEPPGKREAARIKGRARGRVFRAPDRNTKPFWSTQRIRWNGTIWEADATGMVDCAMLDVATERLAATVRAHDETESDQAGTGQKSRRQAVAAALRLQNVRGRQAALESATANQTFARRAEDFDQNDYLLACGNGIIDLRTQEFRAGRREDMLTRYTPVNWVPEAPSQRWLKFLTD